MEKKMEKIQIHRKFTDAEKLSILDEYLSGASVYGLTKKYSLYSSQIYEWLKSYGIQKQGREMKKKNPETKELETIEEMRKALRGLQRELAEEKLRSLAYDKMIDVAEEMFHIEIRKKVGTKQSKR